MVAEFTKTFVEYGMGMKGLELSCVMTFHDFMDGTVSDVHPLLLRSYMHMF